MDGSVAAVFPGSRARCGGNTDIGKPHLGGSHAGPLLLNRGLRACAARAHACRTERNGLLDAVGLIFAHVPVLQNAVDIVAFGFVDGGEVLLERDRGCGWRPRLF